MSKVYQIFYVCKTAVCWNHPKANQGLNPSGPAGNIGQLNNAQTDPDKRKMIQNQLIILIHAAKCQKKNVDGNNDGQVNFNFFNSILKYHKVIALKI